MRKSGWRTIIGLLTALTLASGREASAAALAEGRLWLEAPSPSEQDGVQALGDVDGDGKADLVVYNQQQGIARVGLSTGSSFQPLRTWATGLPRSAGTVLPYAVADASGDGKADLIAFVHGDGQAPGSANTFVALSTGRSFQYGQSPVWNDGFCITEQTCVVSDVNGDGRADIAAFTQNFGLVWISLSTGAAFGANAVWHNFFCIRGEQCALGDVDGDRKADAILFKPLAPGVQKGNVLVAASTGQGFGAPRTGHGFFCIDAERCLVGDLNGDRRADVLLVKGMVADPGQPAEVLASLSNGTAFINPVPFTWGRPRRPPGAGGWGQFFLADVTGDGRADLVETFTIGVPQPGGSTRTIKTAYFIQPVVDVGQASAPPAPPTGEGPGAVAGYGAVDIYNCDPDQHRFTYWVADATTGRIDRHGPDDAMYSESGYCPDPGDEPFTIDLAAGHRHDFVAVDPEAIGCEGRDDPTIVACAKHRFALMGAENGPTARVTLQAGPIFHLMAAKLATLTLPLPELRLRANLDANIDFSVKREEILDWLGNDFSKYIQFSEGLRDLLEGRRLKRPVFVDVAFFKYEQAGGKVRLEAPDGALDPAKARAALLEGYNNRYGTRETDLTAILER